MKVKINKYFYEIIFTKDKEHTDLFVNGEYHLGVCMFSRQKIIVFQTSKERTKQTLIHELTHAFIDAYGFFPNNSFNHEDLCEFIGTYSENIVQLANKILKDLK